MPAWSPSCSATACISPTPPAAPPSGAARPPPPPTPSTRTASGPAWANSLFEDNAEHGYGHAAGPRGRAATSSPGTMSEALIELRRSGRRAGRRGRSAWLEARDLDAEASKSDGCKAYVAALIDGGRGLPATVAELAARHPGRQGVPDQEVRVDLRRRRLGLRHRLRRTGPRARLRRGRERLRVRHRGVLQHRRPGLQGLQHRPGGSVRRRRQGHARRSPWPRSP